MPQLFQVLRCYKCLVFQVHQTKKSNKWECKLCGEKQSIKRHYGIGTAKDCRIHVQKLNGIRAEIDEVENKIDSGKSSDTDDEKVSAVNISSFSKDSKWSKYVNKNGESVKSVPDEAMYLNDVEVVLEIPKKRSRKSSINNIKATKAEHIQRQPDISENSMKYDYETSKDSRNPISGTGAKQVNLELETKRKNMESIEKTDIVPINILPTINKNSKWAQYIHDTESSNIETESILSTIENCSHNNLQRIFSLCNNDNDLDSLLDI